MNDTKLSEIIPKNKPFEFEGLDIRPSFRASDNGVHTYSVNIMVTEQMWNSLKTIPRHRIIGGVLYWTDDQDEKTPQVETEAVKTNGKKEKGSYGPYWQSLFIHGIQHNSDLQAVLNVNTANEVRKALRSAFNVDSLTFVEPKVFEEWLESNNLHGLITISRQAIS